MFVPYLRLSNEDDRPFRNILWPRWFQESTDECICFLILFKFTLISFKMVTWVFASPFPMITSTPTGRKKETFVFIEFFQSYFPPQIWEHNLNKHICRLMVAFSDGLQSKRQSGNLLRSHYAITWTTQEIAPNNVETKRSERVRIKSDYRIFVT